MLARKELVGPGGERGRSESSYIGGGMATLGPLEDRPSSSYEKEEEPEHGEMGHFSLQDVASELLQFVKAMLPSSGHHHNCISSVSELRKTIPLKNLFGS